jgi:glucosylceramidase
VISSPSRSQLLTVSFINPDNSVVLVVMNQGNNKTPFFIWINGQAAETTALPHSINTYIIK